MKLILIATFIVNFALLPACTKKKSNFTSDNGFPIGKPEPGSVTEQELSDASLIWKRYRTFEQGLLAGLELSKEQLCLELGQYNCIDTVHLVALGGNEPFDNAQHERPEKPSVLTAVSVGRVILSACETRVGLDFQAGVATASVFKYFNLAEANVSDNALKEQITELYRRLLSRDPNDREMSAAMGSRGGFSSTRAMAVALCYAIGSNYENVFL